MLPSTLTGLVQPLRQKILEVLAVSDGLTVAELSDQLRLSYMGVKGQCANLEANGLLESWRVPRQGAGRPLKLYRTTVRARSLFSVPDHQLPVQLLLASRSLFGSSAAEKLLFRFYQDQEANWSRVLSAETDLRPKLRLLEQLREKHGVLSRIVSATNVSAEVREFSHAHQSVFDSFPEAEEMEQRCLTSVLGLPVRREKARDERGVGVSRLVIGTVD